MFLIKSRAIQVAFVSATVLMVSSASATSMTYVIKGIGSGVFHGQTFTRTAFSFTSVADSAGITNPMSGFYQVMNQSSVVAVNGLGSGAFTNATETIVDQTNSSFAGLSDVTQNRLVMSVQNSALSTYDLSTAVGPLGGQSGLNFSLINPTTAGDFTLTSFPADSTFEAFVTPVPEPATMAALGLGLAAFLRKRKA